MIRAVPLLSALLALSAAVPLHAQEDVSAQDAIRAQPDDGTPNTFDCLLEPKVEVKLSTGTAGVLKDVLVDRGSIVHRGELLAQIEDGVETAAAALAQARADDDSMVKSRRARLDFLTKKRARQEELQAKGATSAAAFDEANSDYQQAAQDLVEAIATVKINALEAQRTREVVKLKSILSPIDGVVVERALYKGEYAYEQAPIMTIAQIDPLTVQAFLPIAAFPSIRVGMSADVAPASPIGGHDTAKVDVLDTVFDSRSETFGVRLALPNPDGRLPAGLRCKVTFPKVEASGAR